MPRNFQVVIPQKLYRSGMIDSSEIPMLIGHVWNVRKIVSLDEASGRIIAPYIPKGVLHVMLPIELSGNPVSQARKLSRAISDGLLEHNQGAVLVHCMAGRDRTGLAIALYRGIKQHWACQAIFEEAESKGYGDGVSTIFKREWDLEICRHCYGDYCKEKIFKEETEETQQADDIVREMREDISHQQGSLSAGAIPPAVNPQQSFAPFMDTDYTYPGQVEIRSRRMYQLIKISGIEDYLNNLGVSERVKKLILEAPEEIQEKYINKLKENRRGDKNDLAAMPQVGTINNYNGIPNSQLIPPSGAPGAPNAAAPTEQGGLVQL